MNSLQLNANLQGDRMNLLEKFRITFQVFAFAIFLVQLWEAFNHFLNPPVVQRIQETPLSNILFPVLYVCNQDQYNYTRGKELGYETNTDFIQGIVKSSENITWRGKNGLSKDAVSLLYSTDYTNFTNMNGLKKRVFILPEGECFKIDRFKMNKDLVLRSHNNLKVYIVDANKANNMMIEITDAEVDNVEIRPTEMGTYEGKRFLLSVELYDHKVHNGDTCTDYTKHKSSYGKCVENVIRSRLEKYLGCLPAWFNPEMKDDKKCTEDILMSGKLKLLSSSLISFII